MESPVWRRARPPITRYAALQMLAPFSGQFSDSIAQSRAEDVPAKSAKYTAFFHQEQEDLADSRPEAVWAETGAAWVAVTASALIEQRARQLCA